MINLNFCTKIMLLRGKDIHIVPMSYTIPFGGSCAARISCGSSVLRAHRTVMRVLVVCNITRISLSGETQCTWSWSHTFTVTVVHYYSKGFVQYVQWCIINYISKKIISFISMRCISYTYETTCQRNFAQIQESELCVFRYIVRLFLKH